MEESVKTTAFCGSLLKYWLC